MKNKCDCVYMRCRSWPFVNVRLLRCNFRKRWHASLVCRSPFASCLLFQCLKPYIPSRAWHSAISLSWLKSQTKDIKIKTKESQARRLERKKWGWYLVTSNTCTTFQGKECFHVCSSFLAYSLDFFGIVPYYCIGPWNRFVCGLLRPKVFFCLFFVCSNRVFVFQRVHRCYLFRLTINMFLHKKQSE